VPSNGRVPESSRGACNRLTSECTRDPGCGPSRGSPTPRVADGACCEQLDESGFLRVPASFIGDRQGHLFSPICFLSVPLRATHVESCGKPGERSLNYAIPTALSNAVGALPTLTTATRGGDSPPRPPELDRGAVGWPTRRSSPSSAGSVLRRATRQIERGGASAAALR